jgi:hypothetical protein
VNELKSISAVKPKRESGSRRMKRKRGGENVGWHRIQRDWNDLVKMHGGGQIGGVALTRWIYFKHLTPVQGQAGLRYADIMRKFDRYHTDTKSRTARAQNYALDSGGEDQELERRASDGTMDQYLADARKAKRQYMKLHKVIAPFHGAKEMLDRLCILDIEPPSNHRASCATVLTLVAKEFGIDGADKRRA